MRVGNSSAGFQLVDARNITAILGCLAILCCGVHRWGEMHPSRESHVIIQRRYVVIGEDLVESDPDPGGIEQVAGIVPTDGFRGCSVIQLVGPTSLLVRISLWADAAVTRQVNLWGCEVPEGEDSIDTEEASEYVRGWIRSHSGIRLQYKGLNSYFRESCIVVGDDNSGNPSFLHEDLIAAGYARRIDQ